MKLNEHEALLTPTLLLVPYSPHHVPTYHTWMQDPQLQQATASEPLTLAQEYAMQESWRNDADKLTFIVCARQPYAPPLSTESEGRTSTEPDNLAYDPSVVIPQKHDAPEYMIGDVNLFLSLSPTDREEDADVHPVVGELEIMIASSAHQGRGLGRQILLAFIWYILSSLPAILSEYDAAHKATDTPTRLKPSYLEHLRVKIGSGNARSISLFESIGFHKVHETPNYFGELELQWSVGDGSLGEVEAIMEGRVPRRVGYGAWDEI